MRKIRIILATLIAALAVPPALCTVVAIWYLVNCLITGEPHADGMGIPNIISFNGPWIYACPIVLMIVTAIPIAIAVQVMPPSEPRVA